MNSANVRVQFDGNVTSKHEVSRRRQQGLALRFNVDVRRWKSDA
jgi:hypothetical protein